MILLDYVGDFFVWRETLVNKLFVFSHMF